MESASARLSRVQEQIQAAARRSGRNPDQIALVAVTKTVSFERVIPLLQAGVSVLGENRVQEAETKFGDRQALRQIHPHAHVHLIGHLQTNKAKKAVQLFDMVQSLDRPELGDVLNRCAQELNKPLPCLVEVKISSEETKAGLAPEQLDDFLARSAKWTSLKIKGLMGIAPLTATAEESRPFFAQLRGLFERSKLEILSMGMSQDFEVAIEEGSTMVRLGTALFGGTIDRARRSLKKIAFVGGGNMGEALVAGLLRSGHWKPSQVIVCDIRHDQLAKLQLRYKIQAGVDNRWAVREADIILIAVKPQQMPHLLKEIGPVIQSSQLVLSIAAGVPIKFIESSLAKGVPVVRIMPNTPALVGAGAAAIALGRWAKASHEKIVTGIFSTVGSVVTVAEKDMDAVTALSGSGPAYLFYLAEAMQEAGVRMGLAPHIADGLTRQTLKGASLLLAQSHEEPRTLRQRVTSPGGTTEAAIKILEQTKAKAAFIKAIQRAQRRSLELAKTY